MTKKKTAVPPVVSLTQGHMDEYYDWLVKLREGRGSQPAQHFSHNEFGGFDALGAGSPEIDRAWTLYGDLPWTGKRLPHQAGRLLRAALAAGWIAAPEFDVKDVAGWKPARVLWMTDRLAEIHAAHEQTEERLNVTAAARAGWFGADVTAETVAQLDGESVPHWFAAIDEAYREAITIPPG